MKVAFMSLTGCEGCLYNVLNEQLMNLLARHEVEIVNWRLLGLEGDSEYDVLVIEGSVTSKEDYEKLKYARRRSKILVALGTCAVTGGVQAGLPSDSSDQRSMPIESYVKVDYYIRGCPAKPEELFRLLETIARGVTPLKYERRFNLVERPLVKISDSEGFLLLDSSKCVVCGRCIEVCKVMHANVLNYVNRGILTVVSTPYNEPFDRAGCHYCGLCVAYCPVGAIAYKIELNRLIERVGSEIYIEPEALASIAEAENTSPSTVLRALRTLGYERVVIYSNVEHAIPGKVYAKSPVEYYFLKRAHSDLSVELLTPRIPSSAIYVTQCVAWRRLLKNAVTTRELQILLRSALGDVLPTDNQDDVVTLTYNPSVRVTGNLRELEKAVKEGPEQAVVFEMCPGGCLMGGGQPLSRLELWNSVLERRQKVLRQICSPCGEG